jgi:hypothetical protein
MTPAQAGADAGGGGGVLTVAALYVETGGPYFSDLFTCIAGVDPWDEARDARLYAGPHPVVAHPPCQRWGDMWMGSPLAIAQTGDRKKLGDDGGCFAAALAAVRRWGGVLEHPEGSRAWAHFGLTSPPREGGWVVADNAGGWTCRVEQVAYGHVVRKPTWLYAHGVELPALKWGVDPRKLPSMAQPSAARIASGRTPSVNPHGIPDKLRVHTPPAFRDLLLSIARTYRPAQEAAA